MELAKKVKRRENGGEEGSNHEASTRLPSLPLELMTEILLRLPARSVEQFRCVSKPFCSLLSDPKFAKNHLDLILENDAARSDNRRLILYLNNLFSVDFDRIGDGCEGIRDLTAVELDLDLLCKMKEETGTYNRCAGTDDTIVGSSNGLVCTSTYLGEPFVFLCNPTTGESKRIPGLPKSLRTKCTDNQLVVEIHIHGFAFDALADDYKVVKFVLRNIGLLTANVYSLKSNSWKQICDLRYRFICPTSSGVHLNGSLHWVAYFGDGLKNGVVAAFDVETEEFRDMSLPDEAKNCPHSCSKLEVGILKGCLCLAYKCSEMHDVLWVMKEYGLESSWSKIQLSMSYKSLKPICSTKNDEEVLLVLDEHLVLYNFDCNTLRNLEISGVDFGVRRLHAKTYVESLISPNSYVNCG